MSKLSVLEFIIIAPIRTVLCNKTLVHLIQCFVATSKAIHNINKTTVEILYQLFKALK